MLFRLDRISVIFRTIRNVLLIRLFTGFITDCWTVFFSLEHSNILYRHSTVKQEWNQDQSIWHLFYAIFTGCQFDSGSRLRKQSWSTSVCTAWLHSTFRCIASRRQQSPAGVFDPLTPADWLFHAPEQTTVTAASLSKDLGCGTVFLLNFVHQTSRWRHSETDLRHSCNCYPAHLQLFPILHYINALNNNNINTWLLQTTNRKWYVAITNDLNWLQGHFSDFV